MNFEYKNTYSFKTKYPEILGYSFENFEYIGSVSYEIANTLANNLGLELINILETINAQSDIKYNIEDLEFIILRKGDEQYVLAKEWIDPLTLKSVNSITLATITISGPSMEQVTNIERFLKMLGLTNFQITLNTSS